MKRFQKLLLVFGLIAISAAVVAERVISNKLRSENRLLTAELASMKSEQEAGPQHGQKDDLKFSKTEQEELLRLRSEVGQLRTQKTELERLRHENQQLKAGLDSEAGGAQAQWKSWLSELRTNSIKSEDFLSFVPSLSQALTNSDPSVRAEAAKILAQIGLRQLLETNLTAQEISDLKKAGVAAVPGLLGALRDPDPLVCANAAITLGFIRENAQEVVPALMENLSSDQFRIAGSAAKSLGRFKGDARDAVPALLQLAQSSNPNLREVAIEALRQIDPVAARNASF